MPARGGLAAGPCTFEPNARRDKVRRHLHERHRTSDREAAVLMAGIAPITRGEDMAVDGPRRREGMHGSEDGESDEELDGGRELEDEREREQLDLHNGGASSSSSSSSSDSSNSSPSFSFLAGAAEALRAEGAGGEDDDGRRERGPVRESFLVGAIDEEEEGGLAT